jgi:predicted nucleic acid-binding protein
LIDVADNIKKYSLDFDDSYQYTIAEKYDLTLVTFDKDFKALGLKKKTPQEIISK